MKILFVCQQYIHAARWINQLKDIGHEIYVFDCLDKPIHKDLLWTNYTENWSKRKVPYIKGEYFLEKKAPKIYSIIEPLLKVTASEMLLKLVKEIQPDLVHSLEMQSQTYHVLKVKNKLKFKWAYFCWGNDLFLFEKDKRHSTMLKKVLQEIDFLFVDTKRDVFLAKKNGFKDRVSGVFPGGGGYDLEKYQQFILPISERKLIIIKGYHHWTGRALHVLKALELIIEDIKEYNIYVYSAHDIIVEKINEMNTQYGLNIQYSSRYNQITQEQLFEKFGKAKIAIGNNISDGIPNTLLEAIICGAFPIQSNPGGATEDYIEDGKNGLLIHDPNNINEISELIKHAIHTPKLLEKGFKINKEIAKELEYTKIQKDVIASYKQIEANL